MGLILCTTASQHGGHQDVFASLPEDFLVGHLSTHEAETPPLQVLLGKTPLHGTTGSPGLSEALWVVRFSFKSSCSPSASFITVSAKSAASDDDI